MKDTLTIYGVVRNDSAGTYYRLSAPLSVLRYKTRHEIVIGPLTQDLPEYDVVVMQQMADPLSVMLAQKVQQAGGVVIYDVDDYLFDLPPSWPSYDQWYVRGKGIPRDRLVFHEMLLRGADLITCPTTPLAGRLIASLGLDADKVHVLPNCVLMGDWDVLPSTEHNLDGPVIGWFGSSNHWDEWFEIMDSVLQAVRKIKGYLVVAGMPEVMALVPDKFISRVRVQPLTAMRNMGEIRALVKSFDVGLAWCTAKTEASRCRSPLKALQYGACGVPIVASETVYGRLPGWEIEKRTRAATFKAHEFGITVPQDRGLGLTRAIVAAVEQRNEFLPRAERWQQEVWDTWSYELQVDRWLEVILEQVAKKKEGYQ